MKVLMNYEEYQKAIFQLNVNNNRRKLWMFGLISALIAAIVGFIIDKDIYFGIVLGVVAYFFSYQSLKNKIYKTAKSHNFIKDITSLEQIILEDKIVEKITLNNDLQRNSEYYYKDVMKVEMDKNNYYLFLNDQTAIIVSKKKLESKETFESILKKENLLV